MEIDINQNKISIGDKYHIFIDGQKMYFASTKLLRWLSEINLFKNQDNRAAYTIKKKWSWFKTSYNLISNDSSLYEFRTKNIWRLHYCCQVGADLYEIYGHKGRKYSIYKNDVQIAWWDKEAVTWFNGDNYKMMANNDCNVELLMCFCLIIDNATSNDNDGNTVTIDIGNIGLQAKAFDNNWRPK